MFYVLLASPASGHSSLLKTYWSCLWTETHSRNLIQVLTGLSSALQRIRTLDHELHVYPHRISLSVQLIIFYVSHLPLPLPSNSILHWRAVATSHTEALSSSPTLPPAHLHNSLSVSFYYSSSPSLLLSFSLCCYFQLK